MSSRKGAQGQNEVKSFKDMTREEKREYQEKIKKASQGPKQAEMQIKMLDGMVAGLKRRRAKVASLIEKDEKMLAQINRKSADIHVKYDPLAATLDDRRKRRKDLAARIQNCNEEMKAILAHTKNHVFKVNQNVSKFSMRTASETLQATRGYSTQSHRLAGKKGTKTKRKL